MGVVRGEEPLIVGDSSFITGAGNGDWGRGDDNEGMIRTGGGVDTDIRGGVARDGICVSWGGVGTTGVGTSGTDVTFTALPCNEVK